MPINDRIIKHSALSYPSMRVRSSMRVWTSGSRKYYLNLELGWGSFKEFAISIGLITRQHLSYNYNLGIILLFLICIVLDSNLFHWKNTHASKRATPPVIADFTASMTRGTLGDAIGTSDVPRCLLTRFVGQLPGISNSHQQRHQQNRKNHLLSTEKWHIIGVLMRKYLLVTVIEYL